MHAVRAPCVASRSHLLLAEAEAKLGYQALDLFERKLHLNLGGLLRVVPVQRANVHPEAAHFQDLVERCHVV